MPRSGGRQYVVLCIKGNLGERHETTRGGTTAPWPAVHSMSGPPSMASSHPMATVYMFPASAKLPVRLSRQLLVLCKQVNSHMQARVIDGA